MGAKSAEFPRKAGAKLGTPSSEYPNHDRVPVTLHAKPPPHVAIHSRPIRSSEMMPSLNFCSLQTLSDEQLDTLVSIVLDEYGPTLARVRFNDVILSLFELIAGLDNLPQRRRQRYLTILWSKYRKAIRSTGVH